MIALFPTVVGEGWERGVWRDFPSLVFPEGEGNIAHALQQSCCARFVRRRLCIARVMASDGSIDRDSTVPCFPSTAAGDQL